MEKTILIGDLVDILTTKTLVEVISSGTPVFVGTAIKLDESKEFHNFEIIAINIVDKHNIEILI